ncbi:MAG: NAD-dependent dehydratase [Betaproteobacteria bacterium]|nr:NAD-dependent dehydratase [Betaproteobacteria bacterium]
MNILLLGGSGRIGHLSRAALEARGHCVTAPSHAALDLAQHATPESWRPWLAGIDAVVHAAGILRESGQDTFAAHLAGTRALFFAAFTGKVVRIVYLSAAGADEAANVDFFAAKGAADSFLSVLDIDSAIIRPGPTYLHGPGETRRFAPEALALQWPGAAGDLPTTSVEEVIDAIVRATEAPAGARPVLQLAGAPLRANAPLAQAA